MENNVRNQHRISKGLFASHLFIAAVMLLLRVDSCRSAPVQVEPLSETSGPTVDAKKNSSSVVRVSTSELQGDEFADLQELRSGLKVLNTIVKNQLAVTLQLSEGEEAALDSASNATGIRLALTITCSLKKAAEAFRSVPTNTSTNGTSPNKTNLTLLRTVSDSLFESSCLWVESLYSEQYPHSSKNFTCDSSPEGSQEMTGICSNLDILIFTETLWSSYYEVQSSLLNDTNSDKWIEENIERDSVRPEVYDIIYEQ